MIDKEGIKCMNKLIISLLWKYTINATYKETGDTI